MSKRISITLLVCLLVTSMLSGCGKSATTQGAGGKSLAVPVTVQSAARSDVAKELIVSGQLIGQQSVVISPKISGKVAQVNVELGSVVSAGSVLFKLDDTDILDQIRQSEASVWVMSARKKVSEQNLDNAARQFERYQQLYQQGAISSDTFDTYRLKLDQASSEEPTASLAQAQASLAYQQDQLANTAVLAPINGEVAARNVEVGSIAAPSTQAVTLVNLDRMKVQISVGEEQIVKLKQGQEVKVQVPSVQAEPFTGRIENLSPAADSKTKSFIVEIMMDNPGHVLKQGMFAEVHIVTERRDKALTVPVDAVIQRAGENYVFTFVDGKAKENKVKTGISDSKLIEITEGLVEGDQVIVLGQQSLVDGSQVTVQGGGLAGQAAQPAEAGKPEAGQPKGEN